jgi:uncharacterized protein YukE
MADTGAEWVKASLDNAVSGLEATRAGAAGVGQRVEGVQRQLAAVGYPGVARNLEQVKTQLHTVCSRADAVSDEVAKLSAQTVSVTDESTPSQVIAVLTPVKDGIDGALTGATAILDGLAQTQRLIGHCLEGGSPEDLLGAVDQVKATARTINKALAQADKATDQAIEKARQSGKH